MKRLPPQFKEFRKHRDLVSIRRAGVDDHSIQGFILDFSDDLVLLHHVYDFHSDGLLLLRCADITSCEAGATNRFQRDLLRTEGILDQVDFHYRAPIRSYSSFLHSLPAWEIVIVEDELSSEPEFLIGTVHSVDDWSASIRFFSGAAVWDDEPREIPIERISSCQVRTNYTAFYTRHFQRQKSATENGS